MARLIDQLTEVKIRKLTEPGLYPDGRGSYVQIRPGSRAWIYRFTLRGRTRDMGLGSLAEVTLMQARSKAAECRALRARGIDPIEHAKEQRALAHSPIASDGLSFKEAAEAYMAEKLPLLRSEKTRRQWRQTLRDFAYPLIGHMSVAAIETSDVLSVLRPIWLSKPETGKRLCNRIARVLARATVEGHRKGANPAAWRGHLQEALPKRSDVRAVVNHPAMDFRDVRDFMTELIKRDAVSAVALRFLILTACRTGEVIGARWAEIDKDEGTWTVPAARTKTNRVHIVPLSTAAVAVLREMEPLKDLSDGFIFPGHGGAGLSQMSMLMLLQRRMKRDVTVHGFRSAFRDWAGDVGEVPREIAEAALSHAVGDETERAYRRRTAIDRRRRMMQAWADYVLPQTPGQAVDICEARRESAPAG